MKKILWGVILLVVILASTNEVAGTRSRSNSPSPPGIVSGSTAKRARIENNGQPSNNPHSSPPLTSSPPVATPAASNTPAVTPASVISSSPSLAAAAAADSLTDGPSAYPLKAPVRLYSD